MFKDQGNKEMHSMGKNRLLYQIGGSHARESILEDSCLEAIQPFRNKNTNVVGTG